MLAYAKDSFWQKRGAKRTVVSGLCVTYSRISQRASVVSTEEVVNSSGPRWSSKTGSTTSSKHGGSWWTNSSLPIILTPPAAREVRYLIGRSGCPGASASGSVDRYLARTDAATKANNLANRSGTEPTFIHWAQVICWLLWLRTCSQEERRVTRFS